MSGSAHRLGLSSRDHHTKTPFETRDAPPVAKLLGWNLIAIDRPNMVIEVEFEATAYFLNQSGHLQGGMLCAMLDDTLA